MWWLWVLLGILGLLLIAALLIGYFGFRFSILRREVHPHTEESLVRSSFADYIPQIKEGWAWIDAQPWQKQQILSRDGLKLAARYLPHENARGTAILCHGYRSQGDVDFSVGSRMFYEMGLNVLLIDHRSHGESEGKYICYGVKERYDVLGWVEHLNKTFGADTPIVLAGMSMGSATVQMASGLELPRNVKCVIADCGFTSPWDINYKVARDMHLPAFVMIPVANIFCKLLAGFGLREYSTLDAQKVNKLPTLFIHGTGDDFVPCEMSKENYEACQAPKKLVLIPEAGHCKCYFYDKELYSGSIREWVDTYCK